MLQYYHELWTRRSHMIIPLNDLVSEVEKTKVIRSNGTKEGMVWGQLTSRVIQPDERYTC